MAVVGSGTPTNGHAYANNSAADWGVNHDGAGRLTGYAWGANIGWVAFEQTHGQPQVDLRTGLCLLHQRLRSAIFQMRKACFRSFFTS